MLLVVLYDNLPAPSSGIEFPCPEEIKRDEGGEQIVPLVALVSFYKENPDRHALKSCFGYNIIRPEFTAVFDLFLLLVLLDQSEGTYFSIFCIETGLALSLVRDADLYHPEPMTLHMPGFYNPMMSVQVNQLSARTYLNLILCRISLTIICLASSILDILYSPSLSLYISKSRSKLLRLLISLSLKAMIAFLPDSHTREKSRIS